MQPRVFCRARVCVRAKRERIVVPALPVRKMFSLSVKREGREKRYECACNYSSVTLSEKKRVKEESACVRAVLPNRFRTKKREKRERETETNDWERKKEREGELGRVHFQLGLPGEEGGSWRTVPTFPMWREGPTGVSW